MQYAHAIIALGGDRRNTVPRAYVTPAEASVLAAIHGDDAVYDIEILKDEDLLAEQIRPNMTDEEREAVDERRQEMLEWTEAEEIARLREKYPTRNEEGVRIVGLVFPGARPELPQDFADLNLPDELYKAIARAAPTKAEPKAASKTKKPAAKKTAEAPSEDMFG